ncbi:GNAT family N-acetyltransferase [Aquabacterium humicola]|uniref:GNAT family N-acetyltransferase n=1 Tax=Aquabacterium humicola TaxID=3237377 RepID=UPI002542988A|nr:GNAT family N-acetyltransferase [Rubrivivax pictus]
MSEALQCRRALAEDYPALAQLLELYQYDLCELWPQEMDPQGRYGYNLSRHRLGERFHAHIAFDGPQPVGFALVAPALVTRQEGAWMEQFFIHRRWRRSGAGRRLAEHVFRSHPGCWEVGQVPGNVAARAFWRRVIGELTAGAFVELEVTEGWWHGTVQQFEIPATA